MPVERPTRSQRDRGDWAVDIAAMAGSLVHEIKNPLSTIGINAQLLLEDWKDPQSPKEERAVRRLRVMVAEIQRLERIMQTFLRFTERHELSLASSSLNSLLEDLVEFVSPDAEKRGVRIRLGLAPGLASFEFDSDLLRQVVLNLVQNALQAMDAAGGELILKTSERDRDGQPWAVCEVIDTGPGISPRALDKVFDLYYSTKKDGSGLGLAISKRIVEEHGGRIELRSEEGKGSQFVVWLPMRPRGKSR